VLGGTDGWVPPLGKHPAWSTADNLPYGTANGETLLLDAHVPVGPGPFPVVLIIHGGGWSGGDKANDIVPVFGPVATNFTWFTIAYRLAPTNRWPACRDDVRTAIRWVKQHAAEYKGDPRRIALMGYSAGGQLATLTGLTPDTDTAVQAVVGMAPPTDVVTEAQRRGSLAKWISMGNLIDRTNLDADTLARLKELSPRAHIHAGAPPFLLIQGDADKTVPPDLTHQFQADLQAAGVPCDFIVIPGASHRIAEWPKLAPQFPGQLQAWLEKKLGAATVSDAAPQ